MIAISAEQAEQHFAKRAKNWQLSQPAPAAPETKPTPKTIGSGLGNRAGSVDKSRLSKDQRHEEIRARLRASQQTN
jgi:hypothetical protein